MTNVFFRLVGTSMHRKWIEVILALRALLFVGRRYTCPCCGWRLRAFTHGGISLRIRRHGYCPRCNSKARHRRDWLYLANQTNLFSARLRVLHVSPKYAISRRLIKMSNLDYVGVGYEHRPNIQMKVDLVAIPFQSDSFDAIICIHVLEHIEDDRLAMRELFRVLKPGGWAFISTPVRLDRTTYEDSNIVDPEARRIAFGEEQHVRVYGADLQDRLAESGFTVQLDLAEDIDQKTREIYGLHEDENVFFCIKPVGSMLPEPAGMAKC